MDKGISKVKLKCYYQGHYITVTKPGETENQLNSFVVEVEGSENRRGLP